MNKKLKGIIYSRVSTEDQEYARQTEDLVRYAKEHNIEVIRILEEKDSGFNDYRPKFQELLTYTKDEIDIVLVWEITRISRRSIKLQETVLNFIDKGIRIFAYKDGFSTHNPDGTVNSMAKMVLAIQATYAEEEAKTLKARTKAGRTFNVVHKGYSHTTKRLYGYNLIDNKLTINEPEAEQVRKMFQMCVDGRSFRAINLYMRGADPNHKWKNGALACMFKNTTYKGYYMWEGKDRIETPQIVDEDLWEKAQEAITSRAKNRSKGTEKNEIKYLLKGLLVCPNCGRHYTHSNFTYKCVSNVNRDYERCGSTNVTDTVLDKVVWKVTSEVYKDAINEDYLADKKKPYLDEIAEITKDMARMASRKRESERESDKQFDLAMKFQSTNPTLYKKVMARIDELGEESQNIDRENDALVNKIAILNKKIKSIDEGSTYEITEQTEKNDFLHKVIDKIVVYGNRSQKILQIFYKMGAIYDLVYYKKKWYYFKNDGCITYTDTKKLKAENPDIAVEDVLIEVTTTNNGMFCKDVLGGYTFDKYIGILKLHNLLKEAQKLRNLVYKRKLGFLSFKDNFSYLD